MIYLIKVFRQATNWLSVYQQARNQNWSNRLSSIQIPSSEKVLRLSHSYVGMSADIRSGIFDLLSGWAMGFSLTFVHGER